MLYVFPLILFENNKIFRPVKVCSLNIFPIPSPYCVLASLGSFFSLRAQLKLNRPLLLDTFAKIADLTTV